jgi:hypothetical protein
MLMKISVEMSGGLYNNNNNNKNNIIIIIIVTIIITITITIQLECQFKIKKKFPKLGSLPKFQLDNPLMGCEPTK